MHQVLKKVFYEIRTPNVDWNSIGGHNKLKQTLPKWINRGDSLFIWGPKGVGIPMLAEALAKEQEKSFVFFCLHKIFDIHGMPKESHWEEVWEAANAETPVILFISDLEWIVPRKNANYEWEQGNSKGKPWCFAQPEISLKFYEDLKKVMANPNITVVGASYRIDTVDSKVLHLFNHKIFVSLPEFNDRKEIFEIYLKKYKINENLSKEVTSEWLAEISPGFIGNDIDNVCKQVLIQALKHNVKNLTPSLFQLVLKTYVPWLSKTMIEAYYKLAAQHPM
ncbi:AAA family ATPase [Candidatus Poribacteria bacterium]|nr:AAA family ATPase [Candidatus Poribacteria bacterium]